MPRTYKLHTNVISDHQTLAVAKSRGRRVTSGRKFEVLNGALVTHTALPKSTVTRVLDLPHRVTCANVPDVWPVDHQFMLPRNVTVAPSRDGFTSGNGLKEVPVSALEGDGTAEVPLEVVSLGAESRDVFLVTQAQ